MNTATSSIATDNIVYTKCPLCSSNHIKLFLATKDYSISKEPFELYDCGNCGFRFTQKIPSAETIGPYYKSEVYISHSDTKEGLVNRLYHFAREWMLHRKQQLIASLVEGKKLLDIGSGTGYFLNHMQQHGYQVEGVEIDQEARKTTKEKFGISVKEPNTFLKGKLSEKVDIITLWHVLEHLHDLEGYMRAIHRQLTPNGVVLIAVPNHTAYEAQYYEKYWAAYDVPRHLWHFTPKTIAQLAERTGFYVSNQKRLPLDSFYNALLSEQYKGNGLALVKGGIVGGISLLNSFFNSSKSSSPIYILKKT